MRGETIISMPLYAPGSSFPRPRPQPVWEYGGDTSPLSIAEMPLARLWVLSVERLYTDVMQAQLSSRILYVPYDQTRLPIAYQRSRYQTPTSVPAYPSALIKHLERNPRFSDPRFAPQPTLNPSLRRFEAILEAGEQIDMRDSRLVPPAEVRLFVPSRDWQGTLEYTERGLPLQVSSVMQDRAAARCRIDELRDVVGRLEEREAIRYVMLQFAIPMLLARWRYRQV